MKRLTPNQIVLATVRVNRKAYASLFGGILLAVFLATATSLCAWGAVRGHEEQMAERVGWMDLFLLDGETVTDDQLRGCGFFREIGHVTVNAVAEDTGICAGYYDETAERLMNRTLKDGRLPEKTGEMAAEQSALVRLGLDASVGDTLTLAMRPINGTREERTFTLVGILNEQTAYLDTGYGDDGMRFPALLVFPAEQYTGGDARVHRVLTYAPTITYNQVVRNCPLKLMNPYGISREDGTVTFYDSGWNRARNIVNRILIWAVLGAALMLSVCVGITSAMESLLSRKTEDIGMLRAIGATRRQIRRIYGKEAWLLTVTALPAGLGLGVLTVWLISRIAPDQVAFAPRLWLLIPILGFSTLCVFAASRIPLWHASGRMPMGVLRDIGMMRRAGKLRNHRTFRPDRLIAGRRMRLYPLRHLGAAGMTALMLFSTLMLGELVLGLQTRNDNRTADMILYGTDDAMATDDVFSQSIPENALSRQDLDRIAAVPGVDRIQSITTLNANLLMDEVPAYFRSKTFYNTLADGSQNLVTVGTLEGYWAGSDWLFFGPEELADARARMNEDYRAYVYTEWNDRMNNLRGQLGTEAAIVPVRLYVADPDPEALKAYVTDGSIDTDRLDSGEQALVFAPAICAKKMESGGYEINHWLKSEDIDDGKWDIVIRNDAFRSGMNLKLLEAAVTADDADENEDFREVRYPKTENILANVSIGAVLSGPVEINDWYMTGFAVILSTKGAQALGLKLPGPEHTDIFLSDNLSPEAEQEIADKINQIAMSSRSVLENRSAQNREYRAKKLRQILLFSGLILLFFAVSLFIQVSGAARQIRSEIRTIGTLRAVGANLETLTGCYRLPVLASAAAGLIPCLLFYIVTEIPGLRLFTRNHPAVMIPVLAVMTGCAALASVAGIRRRLRGVASRSIVENIREL